MGLLDKLKKKAIELAPDLLGDGSDIELNLPAIEGILKELDEIFADGFQWSDLPKVFGAIVPDLMELAGTHSGTTGEQKRQFVVDAGTVIYFHYNPDIPLLPDIFGIETRVEKIIVPKMIEIAVEAAFKLHKKIKDKIDSSDEDE